MGISWIPKGGRPYRKKAMPIEFRKAKRKEFFKMFDKKKSKYY